MDFEAYYAAQEAAEKAAYDAALVEQYNYWVAYAQWAIPQIVAHARVRPPKEFKRFLIDDQPAIAWEAGSDGYGDWKVYITTEGDAILYTSSYRMVIIEPINTGSEIDELRLDLNQLYKLTKDLPRFAHQVGLELPEP